jgi:glycosyltransferase involved in cell wall biosynthesis
MIRSCASPILATNDRTVEVGASFVGFRKQSELTTYYTCVDVLVLPSRSETWGLVLNETMACGMPVLTTDPVGARADLVTQWSTGFQYPVGELAGILLRFVDDPSLKLSTGLAALQRMGACICDECVNGALAAQGFAAPVTAQAPSAASAAVQVVCPEKR